MKRLALLLTVVFATLSANAQRFYGMVSDPDGYTNIRRGPGTSYAISRRYSSGDYLYYTPVGNGREQRPRPTWDIWPPAASLK